MKKEMILKIRHIQLFRELNKYMNKEKINF